MPVKYAANAMYLSEFITEAIKYRLAQQPGCRGRGVGREGVGGSASGIGVHLTLNSHLWLQEAVACGSGHTPVNHLGWRVNQVRVAGQKPSGVPDRGCLSKHAKTGPGVVSGRE